VIIHAYNDHVRLLSPEPMVVKQPQLTRVEEPTLLCNQVRTGTDLSGYPTHRELCSLARKVLQEILKPAAELFVLHTQNVIASIVSRLAREIEFFV